MATIVPSNPGDFDSQSKNDQKPADADLNWADEKTTTGDKYRIKADSYDISEKPPAEDGDNVAAASGPSFSNMSVHWSVGNSGSPSTDQQDQSAITWFKLDKTAWWNAVYSYELSFNAKDTYDYYFKDASGDEYRVNVFQNQGTHYVQFNSSDPTIVSIRGS